MLKDDNGKLLRRTIQCIQKGIRDLQISTNTDLYQQELNRNSDYYSPFVFDGGAYLAETLDWIKQRDGASAQSPASCQNISSTLEASPL